MERRRPILTKETDFYVDEKFILATSSMQGWRPTMEDSILVDPSTEEDPELAIFGVFDGHGGAQVATHASENLLHHIQRTPSYQEGNLRQALVEGFISLDLSMMEDEHLSTCEAGSTANVVLIKHKQIFCANLGDSRSVAYDGQVINLSEDHKPTNESERRRIINAGYTVRNRRLNNNLAVSRAFGDFRYKRTPFLLPNEQAVSCMPDIKECNVTSRLMFILLACDGIWDVKSSEEVCNFIVEGIESLRTPTYIVEELLNACVARNENSHLGKDNMSVVLILFPATLSDLYKNFIYLGRRKASIISISAEPSDCKTKKKKKIHKKKQNITPIEVH